MIDIEHLKFVTEKFHRSGGCLRGWSRDSIVRWRETARIKSFQPFHPFFSDAQDIEDDFVALTCALGDLDDMNSELSPRRQISTGLLDVLNNQARAQGQPDAWSLALRVAARIFTGSEVATACCSLLGHKWARGAHDGPSDLFQEMIWAVRNFGSDSEADKFWHLARHHVRERPELVMDILLENCRIMPQSWSGVALEMAEEIAAYERELEEVPAGLAEFQREYYRRELSGLLGQSDLENGYQQIMDSQKQRSPWSRRPDFPSWLVDATRFHRADTRVSPSARVSQYVTGIRKRLTGTFQQQHNLQAQIAMSLMREQHLETQ